MRQAQQKLQHQYVFTTAICGRSKNANKGRRNYFEVGAGELIAETKLRIETTPDIISMEVFFSSDSLRVFFAKVEDAHGYSYLHCGAFSVQTKLAKSYALCTFAKLS